MNKDSNEYLALLKEAKSETTSKERLRELAALNDDLAEIVAGNVSASPELLKELANNENKVIIKAVTSNPNTPKETLLKLGEYFPQELLENPIFELLVLEDLKFLEDIPEHIINTLIQQPKVTKFLLNYAVNHQNVHIKETANMQVVVSGEMTRGWHEKVEEIIPKYSVANRFILDFYKTVSEYKNRLGSSYTGNEDFPSESFKLLANFYKFLKFDLFKSQMFKVFLARSHNAEPNVLKRLARDEYNFTRCGVAENPTTPPEILELLAEDSSSSVLGSLATNPNTPVEILKLLATNPDIQIRRRAAKNSSTPPEILKSLFQNREQLIIKAIARNPSTPPEILKSLANDYKNTSCNGIIKAIVRNPNTPIELLRSYANSKHYWMQKCLANNPKAPAEILKSFVAMENKQDRNNQIDWAVARNPNTPTETLEALASNSEDSRIRAFVANNPNTPVKILELFAIDKDYKMRFYVAKNPNTPLKILRKLAEDSNDLVRTSVSENPQCTFEIKKIIFKNFAKSNTPSLTRIALFLSDYAESSVLAENSNSISWLERYAIACNQKTLTDTLRELAQDGNRIVRATAKESLEKMQ